MADIKHIIYDGSEVIAERARADENGKHIPSHYATKEELGRKQDILPNASKAGLVLSSTGVLNGFEWIKLPTYQASNPLLTSISNLKGSGLLKIDGVMVSLDTKTYATEDFAINNGGKIDTIYVNDILQPITNKEVRITLPKYTYNLSEMINDIGFITANDLPKQKTNLSEFTNDSGFITANDLPEEKTKLSELTNDAGFITTKDLPKQKTKLSEFSNDTGFITSNDLPKEKTKLSEFENDTNYTTLQEVGTIPTNISLSLDPDTYILSVALLDKDNNLVHTEKKIDLPLETMVVSGKYLSDTKEVELSLQNGTKVTFGIEDLIDGLVSSSLSINGKSLLTDIELTAEDIKLTTGTSIQEELESLDRQLSIANTKINSKINLNSVFAGEGIHLDTQSNSLTITNTKSHPVQNVFEPTNIDPSSYINDIITSTDNTDSRLYYVKQTSSLSEDTLRKVSDKFSSLRFNTDSIDAVGSLPEPYSANGKIIVQLEDSLKNPHTLTITLNTYSILSRIQLDTTSIYMWSWKKTEITAEELTGIPGDYFIVTSINTNDNDPESIAPYADYISCVSALSCELKRILLEEDLPEQKTKLSEFLNDTNFITANDLPDQKTKLSEFENDTGFITANDLPTQQEEQDPTVPEHVKKITQSDIDKWNSGTGNSGEGGTVITDTLTLSKTVFVPEVPAKEGAIINSIENLAPLDEINYPNYGFALNSEGYYESQNKGISGIENYALCRVTFTVPQAMDIIFDVINNAEQGWDYGIFSNLNASLINNFDRDDEINSNNVFKHFKNESFTSPKKLTYKNVSAGTYTIDIKYRKDSGGDVGNDSLQFKLAEESLGSEKIPSYEYESSQSIKIGDNNNLQIEGKNILREGDLKIAVIPIHGEQDNPISLIDTLTKNNYYLLSGYFRLGESDPTTRTVLNDGKVLLYYSHTDYIHLFNAFISGDNISCSTPNTNSYFSLTTFQLMNTPYGYTDVWSRNLFNTVVPYNYGSSNDSGYNWKSLTVDNEREYNPKNPYNPATVKFVQDYINDYRFVEELEDVSKITPGKLATSTNHSEKSLYYGKVIGQKDIYVKPEIEDYHQHVYLNKNILNIKLNPWTSAIIVDMWLSNNENTTTSSRSIIITTQDTSDIATIYTEDGFYLYNEGSWIDTTDEQYLDIIKSFKQNPNLPWVGKGCIATKYNIFDEATQEVVDFNDYLAVIKTADISESTRLALYEDLDKAGIKTLTSPVRIWDLADGVYKLPTDCSIQYIGETNTSSFNLGTRVSGILTVSSSNITTLQSPNVYEKNIFWEISYGDNQYLTNKVIGRTTSTRGYYNKLSTGALTTNITTPRISPMCNDQQQMSTSSNFWLMGTPEYYSFNNVQHSSSCYIKSNELYSNNSKVLTETGAQTLENKTLVNPKVSTISNGEAELILPSTSGIIALKSDIEAAGGTVSIDTQLIDQIFEEVL